MTRHGERRRGRLGRLLGAVGAFVLGAVFLVAAWTKALDPAGFAEVIAREGVALLGSPFATAVAAVAFEVLLGVALLLGVRRPWVLVPTMLLVAFFVFLNGRAYWRFEQGLIDVSEECGCFGNLVDRTPAEAFWQDLALLLPALGLAFVGRPRSGGAKRTAVAVVAAIGAGAFAWAAPGLPLDDLATRLSPGVEVSEICAGAEEETRICLDALAPSLEEGSHLVVIAELDGEAFLAGFDALNERAISAEGPRVWVLTGAEAEEVAAFRWRWGPAFEVSEAPPILLRPLHRELPRSFRVEDGEVVETWSGLPPGPRAGGEVTAGGGAGSAASGELDV